MQILSICALWFLVFVLLGRFQEIFPFLVPLQLGKLSVICALGVVLAQNASELGYLLTKSPIKKYFYIIIALAFLGMPFSVHRSEALTDFFAYLRLLLSTSIIVALGRKNLDNFKLCLICVVLFLSVQMILQKTTGRVAVSSTYDPNDIAVLCIVFLPIAISEVSSKKFITKMLALAASGGAVGSVALSGSRGGFLALIGITLYSVILAKQRRMLLIVLIILGSSIFMAMAGDALWERLRALQEGTDYNFAEEGAGRLAIWTYALEVIAKRPILGVGIGQVTTGIATIANGPWKTTHNSFLQIGVELGLGGFYAFCAILFFIYKLSLKGSYASYLSTKEQNSYAALRISILGFCIGGFLTSQAYSPIPYTLWALAVIMHAELEKKRNALEFAHTPMEDVQEDTMENSNLQNPVHLITTSSYDRPPAAQALPTTSKVSPTQQDRQERQLQAEAKRQTKLARLASGDKLKQTKK